MATLSLPGVLDELRAALMLPPILNGQGTFTLVANTSTAINAGLALTPLSAAFPTTTLPATIRIKVQATSATGAYVNWLGGTASTATGEYLAPGESQTRYLPRQSMTTSPPTVISTGTPQIEVEW